MYGMPLGSTKMGQKTREMIGKYRIIRHRYETDEIDWDEFKKKSNELQKEFASTREKRLEIGFG
jgi:hypothetical protein